MEPEKLFFSKEHEWVFIDEDSAIIGITDYAQKELGDIVFAELPETGTAVNAGDTPVTLESVKAVSSVYAPFTGEITGVNDALNDGPEIINESPFDKGWIYKMKISDKTNNDLMNYDEYQDYIENLD